MILLAKGHSFIKINTIFILLKKKKLLNYIELSSNSPILWPQMAGYVPPCPARRPRNQDGMEDLLVMSRIARLTLGPMAVLHCQLVVWICRWAISK